MANAKKSTAAKAKTTTAKTNRPTAKTTATRKTAAKTPAKKTTAKTSAKPAAKKVVAKSSFMTVQPTRETAYWLIFSLLILALGIWVLMLTIRINNIYDQIERNSSAVMTLDEQLSTQEATKETATAQ